MKSLKHITLIVIFAFIFTSCAKVYYSTDAYDLAKNHRKIAIIPPNVTIASNKKVEAKSLKEIEATESVMFQNEMYTWMLERKMQKSFKLVIQDIETTNALLKRAFYPENPLTSAELCEILGVDAIMTSTFMLSKPMGDGEAIALALVFGFWGPTNTVKCIISINDCSQKKLIWNYKHETSGSIGSNHHDLVDWLMSGASKRMPYFK